MHRAKKHLEQELFPITDSLLKKLAGKAAYEKGQVYFREGAVQEMQVKGSKITAEVEGTDTYNIILHHTQRELTGACDCPASESMDFCKHCVAVALMRAAQLTRDQELKKQPTKKMSEPEKRKAALREYFNAKDKEAIIEQLVDIIETDKYLRKEWQLKRQKSCAMSVTELRKLINTSIPLNKHLYRSAEVSRYFESVDNVVVFLVEKLNPADEQTLPLVDYTLGRLMQALDTIDDSGGYRLESQKRLNDLLISSLQQAALAPELLAQTIFNLWDKPYNDLLPGIPDDFEHLFNKQAKDHFLALVQAGWESSPNGPANMLGYNYERAKFERVLLKEAYAKKDFEQILSIKTKYAKAAHEFLDIAEICLDFNKTAFAREWLEKAKVTKNKGYARPNALASIEVNILLQENQPQKAIDILWSLYQKLPERGLLDYINQIAETSKPTKNWDEAAIEFHQKQLFIVKDGYEKLQHVNHLVSLLLDHKEYQRALLVCQENKVDAELLLEVAEYFNAQADISVALVYRVIVSILKSPNCGNEGYRTVVELLRRIQNYATKAKQPDLFSKKLTEVRALYRAKRNLMAYLQEAFAN